MVDPDQGLQPLTEVDEPIVVAYGTGVDSTAMLIGLRRRMAKATGKWPPGHHYRYPLQEWGWTREECDSRIRNEGLPVPVKSACFFCPASKKHEVDWLAATHPGLTTTAMEMERLAHERGLTTTRGLGRRWSWTEYLDRDAPTKLAPAAIAA